MKMKRITWCATLSCVFLMSGCSMWDDSANSTANQTTETAPNTTTPSKMEDSMDNMMNYLNEQGIRVDDMEPIDQMDFAAYEGKSFTYNGSTAYLYRLKSDDENMRALLDSAKENGTVKVSMDGNEQMYNASVNGDYLFVYDPETQMGDFIKALGNYVPGASTTTPNTGGSTTTPNPESEKGKDPLPNNEDDKSTTTTDDNNNASQMNEE